MKDIPVIFGKDGRTTIPLPLRRQLGWQAGDTIRFRLEGGKVVISREHTAQAEPAVNLAAELPQLLRALALLASLLLGGVPDG